MCLTTPNRGKNEMEDITGKLHMDKNVYISKAVSLQNLINKRRLLKNHLAKESTMTSKDSKDILLEFGKLLDEN
jgi:hypothetical protein